MPAPPAAPAFPVLPSLARNLLTTTSPCPHLARPAKRPAIYAPAATAPANALASLLRGRWQATPAGGSRVLSHRAKMADRLPMLSYAGPCPAHSLKSRGSDAALPPAHKILRASFASALNDRRYALPIQCLLHPHPLLSPSFRAAARHFFTTTSPCLHLTRLAKRPRGLCLRAGLNPAPGRSHRPPGRPPHRRAPRSAPGSPPAGAFQSPPASRPARYG